MDLGFVEFDFLHVYHTSMVCLRLLVPFVNFLSLALGKMKFLSYRDTFAFGFVLSVLGKVSDWVVGDQANVLAGFGWRRHHFECASWSFSIVV